MAVPVGVILMWGGTNASIPSGWSRVTTLDNKFPKATANGVDPDVTGGSDTHSHTSSHTHTMVHHTHSGNTNNAGAGEDSSSDSTYPQSQDNHWHSYTTNASQDGSLSNSVTYQTVDGRPPYHSLIFITPTLTTVVPTNAIILWNDTSLPPNYNICDGVSGRPDLRNKYIRGANTGADAGSTGGTLNHAHVIDHTHTSTTHTHTGTTGNNSANTNADNNSSGQVANIHTHTITLNAAAGETGSAYTGSAGSADSVEPAYKKLLAIQNQTSPSMPRGTIGMWLGTLANIPDGWQLCDGTNDSPDMRDKHLKIANDTSEIGNTGGSNSHTHAASNSHTHTASGTHTHTGLTNQAPMSGGTGVGPNNCSKQHTHTSPASSSNTTTWNSTTTTSDSSNGEPAYRTVAFIQSTMVAQGGPLIMTTIV